MFRLRFSRVTKIWVSAYIIFLPIPFTLNEPNTSRHLINFNTHRAPVLNSTFWKEHRWFHHCHHPDIQHHHLRNHYFISIDTFTLLLTFIVLAQAVGSFLQVPVFLFLAIWMSSCKPPWSSYTSSPTQFSTSITSLTDQDAETVSYLFWFGCSANHCISRTPTFDRVRHIHGLILQKNNRTRRWFFSCHLGFLRIQNVCFRPLVTCSDQSMLRWVFRWVRRSSDQCTDVQINLPGCVCVCAGVGVCCGCVVCVWVCVCVGVCV